MSTSSEDSSELSDVTVEFVLKLPNRPSSNGDLNPLPTSSSSPSRPSPKDDIKSAPTNHHLMHTRTHQQKPLSHCEPTASNKSKSPESRSADSSDIVQWKAKLVASEDQLKKTQFELRQMTRSLEKEKQDATDLRNELQHWHQKQKDKQQEQAKEQRKWQENAVEWKQKADVTNDQLQQLKSQLRRNESLIQAKTRALEEAKERERRLSEECASRALRTQLVESQLAKVQRELASLQSEVEELRHTGLAAKGGSVSGATVITNGSDSKVSGSLSSERARKELEANARHVRVLSTRLSRFERKCESQTAEIDRMSAENARLHVQLRRCGEQMLMRSRPATPSEQELKAQLEIARDVLMKMHSAMQTVKGEKLRLQEQLQQAKVDVLSAHLTLKKSAKATDGAGKMSGESVVETDTVTSVTTSSAYNQREMDQLLKDLQASSERESDLQEQLQYSEREADSLRRKLTSIEQDNELLNVQLKKLCIVPVTGSGSAIVASGSSGHATGAVSSGRRTLTRNSNSLDENALLEQLKEEELRLVSLRLSEAEQNTQRLQHALEEAQRKLNEAAYESEQTDQLRQRWTRLEQAVQGASPEATVHLFYQQKVELLEQETRTLRKRLLASDQQRQSMQSELSSRIARKPPIAVKSLARSSSLHS